MKATYATVKNEAEYQKRKMDVQSVRSGKAGSQHPLCRHPSV
jgi:hypothetical protein